MPWEKSLSSQTLNLSRAECFLCLVHRAGASPLRGFLQKEDRTLLPQRARRFHGFLVLSRLFPHGSFLSELYCDFLAHIIKLEFSMGFVMSDPWDRFDDDIVLFK